MGQFEADLLRTGASLACRSELLAVPR